MTQDRRSDSEEAEAPAPEEKQALFAVGRLILSGITCSVQYRKQELQKTQYLQYTEEP